MLSGVAAVVGEGNVVEVVASASGDGGEVLDGATHVVGCFECWVDGVPAEDACLVSGFPFGFDELWCGVAFEFCLCATGFCGAYLVWVVCPPCTPLLANAFTVGLVALAFAFENFAYVGFVVLAFVFTDAPLVCLYVLAVTCKDFLSVGRVPAAASLSLTCL